MSDTIVRSHMGQVDVRGPRFAAWVTTAFLIAVLLLATFSAPAAAVLLAAQAGVFAVGAVSGPRHHPYGLLYARVIALRRSPTTETEPTPPLRFAQLLGFVFAAAGLLGYLTGAPAVGALCTGLALFAAFLNAAFGICLGCALYPAATRLLSRSASESPVSP